MESFTRAGVMGLIAAAALSAPVSGTFALTGGTPKVDAYMSVSRTAGKTMLDFDETMPGSKTPIRTYDVDMTKLMHLVVVSDDFTQFIHEHPVFNAKTGHFTISLPLRSSRQYVVYADTEPAHVGQQVFRFLLPAQRSAPVTVPAGGPTNEPVAATTPSPATVAAGPYAVKLGATTLPAQTMQMVPLTIERGGKLASDLHPYLGAAGHAVFIDTATLGYVHVHPMVKGSSMESGVAGPQMVMHVPPLPVGTYKLWLQFSGGGKLYVAPFTIAVR